MVEYDLDRVLEAIPKRVKVCSYLHHPLGISPEKPFDCIQAGNSVSCSDRIFVQDLIVIRNRCRDVIKCFGAL